MIELIPDWRRHLKAKNLSPSTITAYIHSAEQFAKAKSDSVEPLGKQIESYSADLLDRTSAANAAKHYRNLQQWFRWLVEEGELTANPTMGMRPPRVPEQLVTVFTDAELMRMLSACRGNSFLQRRNAALVRVLMDTGIRASELIGMQLDNVDLDIGEIRVMGKGRRVRSVPISAKTCEALARYLRQRNRSTNAAPLSLWIGAKGPLSTSGLRQILVRVGLRANVKDVHPHRFRHTAAHRWLSAGGQERSLLRIMGWRSTQMLARYGASAADSRARDEFRRLNLGDRL